MGRGMRILVTGGLGVNGCWVVRDLLEMGHEPVVFDVRPDFTLLRDLTGEFAFVEGDVTSAEQLAAACEGRRVERVCHLAAVYPDAADADPARGFAVNALATVHVLEAARKTGADRVVFTSSIGALSPMTDEHLEPEMKPVDETFPAYPTGGVYGAAKAASELMGIQYQRLYGLKFAALRFAAIYGLGKGAERHGSHNVIWTEMIENAIAGRPTVVPQGGDQRLDLTYARDVARSVTLACLADDFEAACFTLGAGGRTRCAISRTAFAPRFRARASRSAPGSTRAASAQGGIMRWTSAAPGANWATSRCTIRRRPRATGRSGLSGWS